MHAIGTAARRAGVSIETIRFYERSGVTPAAERAANGRRLYDDGAIARLRLIRRSRDLGFSLADARSLLALSEVPTTACEPVRVIATGHLVETRRKLAELSRLAATLEELVATCNAGDDPCPIALRLLQD